MAAADRRSLTLPVDWDLDLSPPSWAGPASPSMTTFAEPHCLGKQSRSRHNPVPRSIGAQLDRNTASATQIGRSDSGTKPRINVCLTPLLACTNATSALDDLRRRRVEETSEARIELMIVAGELLPLRNVDQRIALVEDAEVGVGREAVIHEAPVVAVEDDHAGHFQMGVGIARDIVLHVQRKRVELAHVYEDVELGIKTPHAASALDELASEDPDALNGARRKISADHQHLYASCLPLNVIGAGNDVLAGTTGAAWPGMVMRYFPEPPL